METKLRFSCVLIATLIAVISGWLIVEKLARTGMSNIFNFAGANSLECYVCNSAFDKHCDDIGLQQPVSVRSYMQNCTIPPGADPDSEPLCRKIDFTSNAMNPITIYKRKLECNVFIRFLSQYAGAQDRQELWMG